MSRTLFDLECREVRPDRPATAWHSLREPAMSHDYAISVVANRQSSAIKYAQPLEYRLRELTPAPQ